MFPHGIRHVDDKGAAMKTLIMRAPRAIARRRLFSTLVLLCILGGTPIFQGAPALAAIPDSTPGAAIPTGDQPDFGPNVYIFDPSMPTSQIQSTVDSIASQQVDNEMGSQRYSL